MSGHARRSRLVALGLSVGGLVGLVGGMVATEHPRAATTGPTVAAPDPFTAGGPATPPSTTPTPGSRFRQTITSAS
ncbi:MAG TPA: hypothetical protein VHT97_11955 [Acidimicrobiales bacterium]|jgi:hypothetical protein|nr:hypothetical protein [Acidimicrobiales bacterium]